MPCVGVLSVFLGLMQALRRMDLSWALAVAWVWEVFERHLAWWAGPGA